MRRLFENSLALRQLLAPEYRKPTAVLLIATFLSVSFKIYGSKSFYFKSLSSSLVVAGDAQFTAALFVFASAFFLLGVVPFLVVKLVFGEPLSAYGVRIGDFAFSCKAVAVIAPVMILLAYSSASLPEFRAEYPLNPLAGESTRQFLQHAVLYLFFFLGWEFCFRGFVQFGLRDAMGDWNAILVQTSLSCLLHIGKPSGEIYGSIVGALVWGIVAFRSRSLLSPILTHWVLGLSLDFFIVTS
jgi:membrane protease YdiL (CAAX protease family)